MPPLDVKPGSALALLHLERHGTARQTRLVPTVPIPNGQMPREQELGWKSKCFTTEPLGAGLVYWCGVCMAGVCSGEALLEHAALATTLRTVEAADTD